MIQLYTNFVLKLVQSWVIYFRTEGVKFKDSASGGTVARKDGICERFPGSFSCRGCHFIQNSMPVFGMEDSFFNCQPHCLD